MGAGVSVIPAASVLARTEVTTRAAEVAAPLERSEVRPLPFPARHVALHWTGNPDAVVTVALSRDGATFGPERDAARDEVGEQAGNGQTYGAIHSAGGAVAVRVSADRPLGRLTVLALTDGAATTVREAIPARPAGAAGPTGVALSRAAWNADESLRFDRRGREVWPPVFQTVQKLVVHHTAGTNDDADPEAARSTIRSMYYYHAVTQGWGDIGYSFLVDRFGNVYQGRWSGSRDATSGEDGAGRGVTAGHAFGYNSGTVGVALLGTLTSQGPSGEATEALKRFLVAKASAHGVDATGRSTYTSPVNGTQAAFPNISGHREVPDNATECPGDYFLADAQAGLPAVVAYVRANATPPDTVAPPAPASFKATAGRRQVVLSWQPAVDPGAVGGQASGVAGYEIFRNGSTTPTARTTAPTFTDTGLRSGTTYSYTVRAYDGAANRGAPTAAVTARAG